MSEIKHDIAIKAAPEKIFAALTTVKGLQSWFTTDVKGTGKLGDEWEMHFENQPSFRWAILASDKSNKVSWKCIEGPGNAADTEVDFLIKESSDHHAVLTIVHRGWSKDDPKFDKCVDIWRALMSHLQHYCEQGTAEPTYH